jgi:hypothetical protein
MSEFFTYEKSCAKLPQHKSHLNLNLNLSLFDPFLPHGS